MMIEGHKVEEKTSGREDTRHVIRLYAAAMREGEPGDKRARTSLARGERGERCDIRAPRVEIAARVSQTRESVVAVAGFASFEHQSHHRRFLSPPVQQEHRVDRSDDDRWCARQPRRREWRQSRDSQPRRWRVSIQLVFVGVKLHHHRRQHHHHHHHPEWRHGGVCAEADVPPPPPPPPPRRLHRLRRRVHRTIIARVTEREDGGKAAVVSFSHRPAPRVKATPASPPSA